MAAANRESNRNWARNLLCATAVCVQFLTIFFLKVNYSKTQQAYDSHDETAYYWSESAFQYRYAKLVGEGKAIPEVDVEAQAPEGVAPYRELTLFMEQATGRAYRFVNSFRSIPFREFVIYFVSFTSSLSILVFFFAALQISGSPLYATLMTAVYAFNPASWSRFIANYVYEGFAMPWLFLGFTALLMILNGKAAARKAVIGYSVLAGATICIGLLSWHFARFYLIVLVAALVVNYFIVFDDSQAAATAGETARIIAACCFAAGVLSPMLRQNGFVASPPMLMLYVLALTQAARARYGYSRTDCLVGYAAAVVSIAAAINYSRLSESPAYGHVYSVFIYKLANLLQKPPNPAQLPMEARLLWVAPFNSPALAHVVYLFFPLAIVPVGILAFQSAHPERAPAERSPAPTDSRAIVTALVAVAFMALYLLVERLLGLVIFFLALYSLHVMVKHIRSRAITLAFLAILGIGESAKAFLADSRYNLLYAFTQKLPLPNAVPFGEFSHKKSLLEWVASHTLPGDLFLSGIGIAPQILTYANRPIILQPKFESSGMRTKYVEFLLALYGDEDRFFEFCRKYGAKYFIYESSFVIDHTDEGARYMADALTLYPSTAAFRFHFAPESLKRFHLVYQDSDYRIFRVGAAPPASTFVPYEDPVYSRAEIPALAASGIIGPNSTQQLWTKLLTRIQYLKKSDSLIAQGDLNSARTALNQVLALLPMDAETWMKAAELDLQLKRYESALAGAKRAAELNPNMLNPQKYLAATYLQTDRMDLALLPLKRMTELQPRDPVAYNNLGVIYFKRRDYRESKKYFETACRLNPEDADYAQNCRAIRSILP